MTKTPDPSHRADRDPLLNRADVTKVLKRAGVPPEDIRTLLDGLEFPDRASHLAERLERVGVTAERLMDRMGAGP
jgi:DNA-binding transcriptional MerR regulator